MIIGIGNTLRRDDGAGPFVAAGAFPPNVEAIVVHQLLPELAETIARARRVIFVDAIEGALELGWVPITAEWRSAPDHALDPATMLALAETLFGQAPLTHLLTVPGEDFGFGEGLSPKTEAFCETARERIREWLVAH